MPKETSKKVAKIASKAVRGKRLTKKEKKSLGASALTQAEKPFYTRKLWSWAAPGKNHKWTLTSLHLYYTRNEAQIALDSMSDKKKFPGERVVKLFVEAFI